MIPEVPCVTRAVLADRTNYRKRPTGVQYNLIVIHITDGHEHAFPVADMWRERWHGSSAHFVVGQNGETIQCVPLAYAAFHAHAVNATSVGIEHCARTPKELGPDDPGLPPSEELYAASARLVAYLLRAAGLPPTREYVKGHKEADPATTHDDCPTGAWDWAKYMPMVKAEYDAFDVDGPGAV